MIRALFFAVALTLTVCCFSCSRQDTAEAASDTPNLAQKTAESYNSPCAILVSPDSKTLYVLEKEQSQLRLIDPVTLDTRGIIPLPSYPTGMTMTPDGKTLYVTASCPAGVVAVIDLPSQKITRTIPAGHSPCAPALSPDQSVLAVCDRFANKVHFFKTQTLQEYAVAEVPREPCAAVFTKEGDRLIVANFLPDDPANESYVCAKVSFIETKTGITLTDLKLNNGAIELYDVNLSHDGRFAFVPLVIARYQTPTTLIERGWIATNGMAIIDVEDESLYATVLVDDPELGAANPSSAKLTPDGKTLCVLTAGSHELITMPYEELMKKIEGRIVEWEDYREGNRRPLPLPIDDISFIRSLRTRRPTFVNGPRAMAFIKNNVYIAGYFSDQVSKINLKRPVDVPPLVMNYGPALEDQPPYRRGERYFNDADFCFQKWLTCATCHPDGRADGLNWDLLNDGIGNPKNSRSMTYSIYNPPVMATGIRKNAEYAIRSGMIYIQFHKLDDQTPEGKEVYGCIEEYYRKIAAVVSPYRTRSGALSESAARGEKVFAKAGCTVCHYGPYYSNLKKYDVGTATGMDLDNNVVFKTPILSEIWRTAPYLHDGRSCSMRDIVTLHNPGKRGDTSKLTEREINDLVEYVLSL